MSPQLLSRKLVYRYLANKQLLIAMLFLETEHKIVKEVLEEKLGEEYVED